MSKPNKQTHQTSHVDPTSGTEMLFDGPKGLLATVTTNSALISGWMVWVGWKVQHGYMNQFGLPNSLEEPTVFGSIIRSIGALANIGWVWLLCVAILVTPTFVVMDLFGKVEMRSSINRWLARIVIAFVLWFSYMSAGSALGMHYGQSTASDRVNAPKPTDMVRIQIPTEMQSRYSKELVDHLNTGSLIRVFQTKDFLVVVNRGSSKAFTLQIKDISEISTSLVEEPGSTKTEKDPTHK